jgi:hypothetical protein
MNKTDYIRLVKEELDDLADVNFPVRELKNETVYDEVNNR